MGIRNAIIGFRPKDQGGILENVVFNHLLYKGYAVKTGYLKAREIDFVCTKGGETLYIQVALRLNETTTIDREFGNLLKINDNYPKLVITHDHFKGNTMDGVKHLNIRDFLLSTEDWF
jgi:predicted AAA+ superfamily ATPase